ncbi:MAG: ABC transporter ATP-binding protein [Clostridia bacterium]|nr:ABC transporter ATP-binding protein [Clostridia bacterium]
MICLENISKHYVVGDTTVKALDDVNLSISRGAFTAILGDSGSGKSTLLNILGCLDKATSGAYYFEGENTQVMTEKELSRLRGRKIGFIFQGFHLLPALTAYENIMAALQYAGVRQDREKRTLQALEQVGLLHRRNHMPHQLSGGQQQRVAIARVIAQNPKIILADEPTGNLDSKTAEEIIKILLSLHSEGRTILLITHDEKIAARIPDRIYIKDGRISK